MIMKEESFKVAVLQADGPEICEEIGEILREHYPIVVNTGLRQNLRPPNEGKWRSYYTVIKRSDDGE